MAVLRLALLLAACAGAVACFSPQSPPCAFSCAEDGVCPSGFTCGDDGVCHRNNASGTCEIESQVDAAQDAVSDDAATAD